MSEVSLKYPGHAYNIKSLVSTELIYPNKVFFVVIWSLAPYMSTICIILLNPFVQVILSGGSTKLNCVSKKVQDFFSNAEIFSTIPADEVITVGAAKQVCE